MSRLGDALRKVRRFKEAIDAHTRAADLFRELDDPHGEAAALNDLSIAQGEARRTDPVRRFWPWISGRRVQRRQDPIDTETTPG